MPDIKFADLFNITHTSHAKLAEGVTYPWEVLPKLPAYIDSLLTETHIARTAQVHPTAVITGLVMIGEHTVVGPNVVIEGPAIIGDNCKLLIGCYIRPYALIGNYCVLGNSTEVKHAWLFDHVAAPHYNYIGDSVLGYRVHLGGGAMLANFKSNTKDVQVAISDTEKIDTKMRKFGAALGDEVEIGSGAILNPGTIVGRDTTVYPGAVVRGVIPARMILKAKITTELVPKK